MIHHGDLFDILPTLEANSIDSCVCDPPYGLEFMGKHWDKLASTPGGRAGAAIHKSDNPRCDICGRTTRGRDTKRGFKVCHCEHPEPRLTGVSARKSQDWHEKWAREVYRVLKPGAHLVAFGGTRTFHRMTCAIEDAGFEIRDCLSWLYGQGFPKSLDVSKAIDSRLACGKSDPMSMWDGTRRVRTFDENNRRYTLPGRQIGANAKAGQELLTHSESEEWRGWGTALKPAWEPIILARKTLSGTVAANVLEHGTGALNIDGCRIETDQSTERVSGVNTNVYGSDDRRGIIRGGGDGRWPANVVLDEEAAAMLDEQSGSTESTGSASTNATRGDSVVGFLEFKGPQQGLTLYKDSGGASRFFYVAKPSRAERDRGCEHLPLVHAGEITGRKLGSAGLQNPRAGIRAGSLHAEISDRPARNTHPTVKPVSLMRWLVKLVTPKGGTVLDPFLGSGTTGIACRCEGMEIIGIEREAEYIEIAKARIAAADTLLFAGHEPEPDGTTQASLFEEHE